MAATSVIAALDAHRSWDAAELGTGNEHADIVLEAHFVFLARLPARQRRFYLEDLQRGMEQQIDRFHALRTPPAEIGLIAAVLVLRTITTWLAEIIRSDADWHGQAVVEGRMAS